jgi:hypothetical protein
MNEVEHPLEVARESITDIYSGRHLKRHIRPVKMGEEAIKRTRSELFPERNTMD